MSKLFTGGVLGLSLMALLSPIGCSSDDASAPFVAEADYAAEVTKVFCEAGRSCSCEGVAATCEEDLKPRYAPPSALAKTAGLSWDGECAGEVLAQARGAFGSCSQNVDGLRGCCKVYVGSVAKGEPCAIQEQNGDRVDNCAQGLRCSSMGDSDVCQELCPALAGEGDSCEDMDCAKGLSCSYSAGQFTCQKAAALGESCEERGCAEGLYCSGDYTCSKPKPVGSTCSDYDECEYECDQGVCTAPEPLVCQLF